MWPCQIVNYQETNDQSEGIAVGTKRNLDNVKDYADGSNYDSYGPSPALASKVSDSYSEVQKIPRTSTTAPSASKITAIVPAPMEASPE